MNQIKIPFNQKEYKKQWDETHKDYHRQYRMKNKERIKLSKRKYYETHKEYTCFISRIQRTKTRDSIFKILGYRCVKCGNTDIRCLQFDHIKGNGNKKRGNYKGSAYYPVLLKLQNLKEEMQVLCANCNWIKRNENHEYV